MSRGRPLRKVDCLYQINFGGQIIKKKKKNVKFNWIEFQSTVIFINTRKDNGHAALKHVPVRPEYLCEWLIAYATEHMVSGKNV